MRRVLELLLTLTAVSLMGGVLVWAASVPTSVVRISGKTLLDPCGVPIVVKGVEQVFGYGIDVQGSWLTLVDEIAQTGANALRVLPNLAQLSVADVDRILARATGHGLLVFLSPGTRAWFGQAEVKTMLQRYRPWLVLDAFQEAEFDDPVRWQTEALAAVQTLRSDGYTNPLTVMSNQYGRDLPTLLARGPAVAASDPQVLFGWQAYWGQSGWYQRDYGLSLTEGIQQAAQQAFPVQLGLIAYADPGDPMDYQGAMTAAQQQGVGWLWWNWYNPFGPAADNLTTDGTMARLTSHGQVVVQTHPHGLQRAVHACSTAALTPAPPGNVQVLGNP